MMDFYEDKCLMCNRYFDECECCPACGVYPCACTEEDIEADNIMTEKLLEDLEKNKDMWKYHGFDSEEDFNRYKRLNRRGEQMSWEKYSVISEFLKIAEEKDILGLKRRASAEKNPYQEDSKTIEDKRLKSSEKSIIEEAHPESVYVAESRGDGGLVENEIEHQKKTIEIINKMPTGSIVGRYASSVEKLSKFANYCDSIGETEAADILTEAARGLLEKIEFESFFE